MATTAAVQLLRARPPFILFTDHLAGWKKMKTQTHKRRRWSPVELDSVDEALALIHTRSHFRDRTDYADNYYLCDQTLRWFICFCHHHGWHFWLPKAMTQRPAWQDWQSAPGAQMQMGPPRVQNLSPKAPKSLP
jgi:hypothetical protein